MTGTLRVFALPGNDRLAACNSTVHPSNRIDLTSVLAEGLVALLRLIRGPDPATGGASAQAGPGSSN